MKKDSDKSPVKVKSSAGKSASDSKKELLKTSVRRENADATRFNTEDFGKLKDVLKK